jgi:hypothetical protein
MSLTKDLSFLTSDGFIFKKVDTQIFSILIFKLKTILYRLLFPFRKENQIEVTNDKPFLKLT